MPKVSRWTIQATTVGAYFVSAPEEPRPAPLLVGFHGYGENAEACLKELVQIPGSSDMTVVAVQALHRFYDRKHQEVVGSWMTKVDREQAIADNERYVASVVEELTQAQTAPGLVFLGFSQGASMAYRAAARTTHTAHGVIALGGDLPPDISDDSRASLPRVLIGRGLRDDWFTEEKLGRDLERLHARGAKVEVVRYAGGHEWNDEFRERAGAFLRSVLPNR